MRKAECRKNRWREEDWTTAEEQRGEHAVNPWIYFIVASYTHTDTHRHTHTCSADSSEDGVFLCAVNIARQK